LILSSLFILSILTAQANKFFPATLVMIDGTEKNGSASMPTNKFYVMQFALKQARMLNL
jgi:hypothetical protein